MKKEKYVAMRDKVDKQIRVLKYYAQYARLSDDEMMVDLYDELFVTMNLLERVVDCLEVEE